MAGIEININLSGVTQNINKVITDDATLIAVHNLFAKLINPWVPMDEGVLSQTVEINKDFIRYNTPYAHYQYIGMIYGPNIPKKDEDGNIIGWWSPPGKKKNPTGRPITYGTEKHPLATKEWDKVAMQTELTKFQDGVKAILKKGLDGNGK